MPVPLNIHNIDHLSLLGKEGMLLNMEIQAWLYACKSCLLKAEESPNLVLEKVRCRILLFLS